MRIKKAGDTFEGISRALETEIHKWYHNENEQKLWRPLLKELTFVSAAQAASGKNRTSFCDANIVITGTLSNMTRQQATEVLRLMGANVSESVSRNTDILIVGVMPGARKLGAAMSLGTQIITESQFADMLAGC